MDHSDATRFLARIEATFNTSAGIAAMTGIAEAFLEDADKLLRGKARKGRRRLKPAVASNSLNPLKTLPEDDSVAPPTRRAGNVLADLPVNEGAPGKLSKKEKRLHDANGTNASDASFMRPLSLTSEFESFNGESTSGRPKRAASRIASSNIRKYTMISLKEKVRRPDNSQVDEFGFAVPRVPDISISQNSLRQSKAERDTIAKRGRSRTRKAKDEKRPSSPPNVKDKIANFEKLARENDDLMVFSFGKTPTRQDNPRAENHTQRETTSHRISESPKLITLELETRRSRSASRTLVLDEKDVMAGSSTPTSARQSKYCALKEQAEAIDKTLTGNSSPRTSGVILTASLPSISPVPGTSGGEGAILRKSEDLFESTFNANRCTRSKRGTKNKNEKSLNDRDSSPNFVVATPGISKVRTRKTAKGRVMENSISSFTSLAASSNRGLRENLESTRNITPEMADATYLAYKSPRGKRQSASSVSPPITVIKKACKRRSSKKLRDSFTAIDVLASETFVIPLISEKTSKRTRPVANSLFFDAEGNPITTGPQTLAGSSTELPIVSENEMAAHDIPVAGTPISKHTRSKMRNVADEEKNRPVQAGPSFKRSKRLLGLKLKKSLGTAERASKRFKTPLSPLTNKINNKKVVVAKEVILSAKKLLDENAGQKSAQLRQKKDLALQKKEDRLDKKTKLLKTKNDEKMERVQKTRQMLESEKQKQILQAEREKELKRQQAIEEMLEKRKAEQLKKKRAEAKRLAEVEERKRLEEEARLAKVREMEMEQQKLIQLKIKEQELEEKRAKEQLEEAKKLKEAEKLLKMKLAKRVEGIKVRTEPPLTPISSKYKPKNENDFGLDEEHSENSGDDSPPPSTKAIPQWVAAVKEMNDFQSYFSLKQLATFVPATAKTPNIHEMFNMTPSRPFRRNSSAVWNTPDFTP